MAKRRYGIAANGPHKGELTPCNAKDPATCPYHVNGSHRDLTEDEYREQSEELFRRLNQSHELKKNKSDKGADRQVVTAYGLFFRRSDLDSIAGIRRETLHHKVSFPRIRLGGDKDITDEIPFGSIAEMKVVGYYNDGSQEAVKVQLPDDVKTNRKWKYGYLLLSFDPSKTANRVSALEYEPVEDGPSLVGRYGKFTKKSRPQVLRSPHGGEPIERKDFDSNVDNVAARMTDDDWEYLNRISDTLLSQMKVRSGDRRDKIASKIEDYLRSNSPDAAKLRAFLGKDADLHEMANLITSNVHAMTARVEYDGKNSVRRCLLSRTSNDMNKKRYIASVLFFGGRCCYCGRPLNKGVKGVRKNDLTATGEHIDPMNGNPPGETKYGNMALCCNKCNGDKGEQASGRVDQQDRYSFKRSEDQCHQWHHEFPQVRDVHAYEQV